MTHTSEEVYYSVSEAFPTVDQQGFIRIRFTKKGVPYVLASRKDLQTLAKIAQDWQITLDFAAKPPVVIVPRGWTTTIPQRSERTLVTSIRVGAEDWKWFASKCRAEGTSTCREVRLWIHQLRDSAEYPTTLRRKPLGGGVV